MKNKSVLILGGNSDVGISIANIFSKNQYDIQLATRNSDKLKKKFNYEKIPKKIKITFHEFDILKNYNHKQFIKNLPKIPDIVISVIGLLGSQKESERNNYLTTKVIRTNFEGPVTILNIFANIFEKRGFGTIVGITSVAGERGRKKNYIYGAAKAGLTTYLSGLRSRMLNKNIRVITVIPGFINTKMTKNMNLPKILTANSNDVAHKIFQAIKKKQDVIYVKKIWFLIMWVIKIMPEFLFKKTNL